MAVVKSIAAIMGQAIEYAAPLGRKVSGPVLGRLEPGEKG